MSEHRLSLAIVAWLWLACLPGFAGEITARRLTTELYSASPDIPPDYSGKDLSGLDLAGLDFKRAKLSRANLFGADLTGANLSHADLRFARLDRTTMLRADFSHANVSGATIIVPAAFVSWENAHADAPNFSFAALTGARVAGKFWRASFRGADLSGANFSPETITRRPGTTETTTNSTSLPTEVGACDFTNAKLTGADLRRVNARYSIFVAADLSGADLANADFSKADLSGADLRDANISGTTFDGANLTGVRGLDQARGRAEARNLAPAP